MNDKKIRVAKIEVCSPLLKDLISHYWFLQGSGDFFVNHKLLPVRSVDMIFNLGEPIYYIHPDGKSYRATNFHVNSPKTHFKVISQPGNVNVFGITFKPSGFYLFSKSNMKEVHDDNGDVQTRLDADRQMIFDVLYRQKVENKIELIERILLQNMSNELEVPRNLKHIINCFYQNEDIIRIKQFCESISMSPRNLEKMFNKYLGISPKYFLKLCRFQNSVKTLDGGGNQNLTDICHKNIYYDQSHFIKEFKSFSGCTPKNFMQHKEWIKDVMYFD